MFWEGKFTRETIGETIENLLEGWKDRDTKVFVLRGRYYAGPWTLDEATAPIAMAPDLFFDGRPFDAAQPERYVAGFEIGRA